MSKSPDRVYIAPELLIPNTAAAAWDKELGLKMKNAPQIVPVQEFISLLRHDSFLSTRLRLDQANFYTNWMTGVASYFLQSDYVPERDAIYTKQNPSKSILLVMNGLAFVHELKPEAYYNQIRWATGFSLTPEQNEARETNRIMVPSAADWGAAEILALEEVREGKASTTQQSQKAYVENIILYLDLCKERGDHFEGYEVPSDEHPLVKAHRWMSDAMNVLRSQGRMTTAAAFKSVVSHMPVRRDQIANGVAYARDEILGKPNDLPGNRGFDRGHLLGNS